MELVQPPAVGHTCERSWRTVRRGGHIARSNQVRVPSARRSGTPEYVTAVDHAEADWRNRDSCGGGADRSALRKGGTRRFAPSYSVSGLVLVRAPGLPH